MRTGGDPLNQHIPRGCCLGEALPSGSTRSGRPGGRSQADSGPHQSQVAGSPRKGSCGSWAGGQGGGFCIFPPPLAPGTRLCQLGPWASVDRVTSFLHAFLLINTCAELRLTASDCVAIVGAFCFGPGLNSESGLLGRVPWERKLQPLLTL